LEDADLRDEMERLLSAGQALERFRAMVAAQGGDTRVADDPESVLPKAALCRDLVAPASGYVGRIDALQVGEAARALGAGRMVKGGAIDPAAGIVLRVKLGAPAVAGAAWASLFAADEEQLQAGAGKLESALTIQAAPPEPRPLIYGVVDRRSRESRYV
jgi:thymidine phosphorylase